jgi:hypothetical protein
MAAPAGNTYSSRNNRLLTETLRRVALSGDGERVRKICEEVFSKAEGGDLQAASFIFDRLEGRPAQSVTLSGDENNPLTFFSKVERVLVRSTDKNR